MQPSEYTSLCVSISKRTARHVLGAHVRRACRGRAPRACAAKRVAERFGVVGSGQAEVDHLERDPRPSTSRLPGFRSRWMTPFSVPVLDRPRTPAGRARSGARGWKARVAPLRRSRGSCARPRPAPSCSTDSPRPRVRTCRSREDARDAGGAPAARAAGPRSRSAGSSVGREELRAQRLERDAPARMVSSSASKTTPIPPLPIARTSRHGPTRVPGASVAAQAASSICSRSPPCSSTPLARESSSSRRSTSLRTSAGARSSRSVRSFGARARARSKSSRTRLQWSRCSSGGLHRVLRRPNERRPRRPTGF